MSEQEEKWEKECKKLWFKSGRLKISSADAKYFYLQACRKRHKKWNTLRHNLTLNAEERALRIMDKLEDK